MNKYIAGRQGETKTIGKVSGYSLPESCYFCRTFTKVQSFWFCCCTERRFLLYVIEYSTRYIYQQWSCEVFISKPVPRTVMSRYCHAAAAEGSHPSLPSATFLTLEYLERTNSLESI